MLEVQSIAKTFNSGTPNEVRSLRGVSLTLEPGSWVIIIGTNGSGKSTFLNAVAGMFFVDEVAAAVLARAGSILDELDDLRRRQRRIEGKQFGR